MNKKQSKTFRRIFEKPTRSDIAFKDIENLMLALGFERIEGRGSRVTFKSFKGRILFHRPHPGKETKAYAIENLREFLFAVGIVPEGIIDEERNRN